MAVAFVLKGYPRLSETFIAQEILGLEQRGLDIRLVSLRHPTDKKTHPIHQEIAAPVSYLPEYLHAEAGRVLAGWKIARRLKGYAAARAAFRRDFARDRSRNRIRRFGQACVLAAELPDDVSRLHFHFLHTPASVTRYAAIMRGLPWSGSAHAKDIWTSPDWDLSEKLDEMDWLVTCTAYGAEHLRTLASDPGRVHLSYHGLDLTRFPPGARDYSDRDGSDPSSPVRLLSVGRAVVKKGYDDLFKALAALPRELNWQLTHIGGGSMTRELKDWARTAGIIDRIDFRGAQPQTEVLAALQSSDLFVLASKVAGDGDRDGLPNVLMEAQSQGLTVLSTTVSAVPELIRDSETGSLVAPGDPEALAAALEELIRNPDRRADLGRAGEARVRGNFDSVTCIDDLARHFNLPAG